MDVTAGNVTQIILVAEGFEWSVALPQRGSNELTAHITGTSRLRSFEPFGNHVFETVTCYSLADLERLCRWMNEHAQRLLHRDGRILNPTPSRTWVPIDRSLQVQLQDGEIESEDDGLVGSYALTVLVRLGTLSTNGRNTYGGLQGEVPIQRVVEFCRAIETYLGGALKDVPSPAPVPTPSRSTSPGSSRQR